MKMCCSVCGREREREREREGEGWRETGGREEKERESDSFII